MENKLTPFQLNLQLINLSTHREWIRQAIYQLLEKEHPFYIICLYYSGPCSTAKAC
jgi:hypothetical protein